MSLHMMLTRELKYKISSVMFWLNSIAVAGSIGTLIIYKTSIFTNLLLLISISSLFINLLTKSPIAFGSIKVIRLWVLAVTFYVFAWILSILVLDDFSLGQVERPLKLFASVFLLYNFAIYGIHRSAIGIGAVITITSAFIEHFILNSGDISRRTGLGLNPNAFGAVTAALTLIVIAYAIDIKSRVATFALTLIAFAGVALSLSSGSRGVILVYLLFAIFTGVHYRSQIKRAHVYMVAVMCTMLGIIFSISEISSSAIQRIQNTDSIFYSIILGENPDLVRGSDAVRASMYVISFDAFKDNLLFGAGNNVKQITEAYQSKHPNDALAFSAVKAHTSFHNIYLDTAAKMGFFGLASLIALLILPLFHSSGRVFVVAILSVPIAGGLFDNPLEGGKFLILFALTLPAMLVRQRSI